MKLHHTTGLPDWATVPPSARTAWQRLAAYTHGFVTPGNLFSLAGLALVGIGLWHIATGTYLAGFVWVGVGRLCDLFDGIAADRTGTKSPLGEAVDAGIDKISAVAALAVAGISGVVPWWAVIIIGLHNAANIGIGITARHRKANIHPILAGKVSTALEWSAFACFTLAAAFGAGWLPAAYMLAVAALLLGSRATAAYSQNLFHYSKKEKHGKRHTVRGTTGAK